MRLSISFSAMLLFVALPAYSQDLNAGSRVLIQSEGRSDYSPNIVSCSSESGLCLRDTRSQPANKPLLQTGDGLQVDFPSWEVAYLFQQDGEGVVFNMGGDQIGTFSWSQ